MPGWEEEKFWFGRYYIVFTYLNCGLVVYVSKLCAV